MRMVMMMMEAGFCPPPGFRDWVPKELQRVGCVELLNTVQKRVRPKLHAFGHIHEGRRSYPSCPHLTCLCQPIRNILWPLPGHTVNHC